MTITLANNALTWSVPAQSKSVNVPANFKTLLANFLRNPATQQETIDGVTIQRIPPGRVWISDGTNGINIDWDYAAAWALDA